MPANNEARQPSDRIPPLRTILASILLGIMFLSPLVAISWFSGRTNCVEMPNGFLIGRATVFSQMVGWAPDIAIRYPDGRLFVRGDNTMDFWDREGFGGRYDRPRSREGRYVYLNQIGLITKAEQPELYETIFERKMREHENSDQTSGGHVMRTFLILNENPANQRYWCKTDWFLPDETG